MKLVSIFFAGLGALLLTAGSGLYLAPFPDHEEHPLDDIQRRIEPLPSTDLDPSQLTGETIRIKQILDASPFVPDRAAFNRQVEPPARPEPPPINWQPELVGIVGQGENRRALLIWHPQHAEAQSFKTGDETPWGRVTSLSSDSVEIGPRVVGLFD